MMVLGQYIPGNSYIHHLDPRSKILFVFLFVIMVFTASNLLSFLWLLLVLLLGMFLSRVSVLVVFRSFRPILFLCLILFIFHLWLTEGGSIIWHYSIFTIYEKGWEQGILVVTRLLLLVFVATLLTVTTPPIQLTDGIEQLLKPLERIKVPVHSLAMMMSICLRFIPVIWEEMRRIQKAQMMRGASFTQGSLAKRFKSYSAVWVPLFLSVFRRADELALAMEAKRYRGNIQRTKWRTHAFGKDDFYLLIIWILIAAIFLTLREWTI